MDKPEQWGKIKEIVGAALERDPSERPAFLNAACGADGVIRLLQPALAARGDHHMRAAPGQLNGGGRPYAAAGASYQRHPSRKARHVSGFQKAG